LRMRSAPTKQPDEPVNDSTRAFTHARVRSAPAPASSCDIVLPDNEPPHANRVDGSKPLYSPGLQLASRNSTNATLLGPAARPAVCLLSKPTQNPSTGLQRAVAQRPQPSMPTSPRVLLRPSAPKVTSVSLQRGATQRRLPSTPPTVGKSFGPRPGQVQMANLKGPLCGDLGDKSTNEWVVGRPCVGGRIPGSAHLMRR